MIYQIFYDNKREKLVVIHNPHTLPEIDVLYYTFFDGVDEGSVNQTYLDNNCTLVLECEGDLFVVAEQLKEILQ